MEGVKSANVEAAVQKLMAAITDEAGELRPIGRIEIEPVGRQVRWTIWGDGLLLYTATGRAEDVDGFLSATQMILGMELKGRKT